MSTLSLPFPEPPEGRNLMDGDIYDLKVRVEKLERRLDEVTGVVDALVTRPQPAAERRRYAPRVLSAQAFAALQYLYDNKHITHTATGWARNCARNSGSPFSSAVFPTLISRGLVDQLEYHALQISEAGVAYVEAHS